jgi:hypothetical protein
MDIAAQDRSIGSRSHCAERDAQPVGVRATVGIYETEHVAVRGPNSAVSR